MVVFIIMAALATAMSYGNGQYYKACKQNAFKGEACKDAKKFSKLTPRR